MEKEVRLTENETDIIVDALLEHADTLIYGEGMLEEAEETKKLLEKINDFKLEFKS